MAASVSYECQSRPTTLVIRMPPRGPLSVINRWTSDWPSGERKSTASDRLPLFNPAQ